jgi:hypothetical protein
MTHFAHALLRRAEIEILENSYRMANQNRLLRDLRANGLDSQQAANRLHELEAVHLKCMLALDELAQCCAFPESDYNL